VQNIIRRILVALHAPELRGGGDKREPRPVKEGGGGWKK